MIEARMMETAVVARANATQEALDVLNGIVAELSQQTRDIKLILRKALHVCNLLNWNQDVLWISAELYGYRDDQVLPWYRVGLPAVREWRPSGMSNLYLHAFETVMSGNSDKSWESQDYRFGIDLLVQNAETGVVISSGAEETRWSSKLKKEIPGREVLSLSKMVLQRTLSNLENDVFRWASHAYAVVKFGDSLSDIWGSFRSRVDEKLAQLRLDDAARGIHAGLQEATPEGCRQAMLSCRNLLHDLAQYLWRDPRSNYAHLPDDAGKPIQVTEDRYINRLIAYQHQKGMFAGASGDYLKAEWGRLRGLNALASSGKDTAAVSLEDARLTAISTYVAIGELVGRTDMAPVMEYQ